MNKQQATKLEKGGWTLSLRKMAIDVMDKMILRPVAILISDPRNGNINTFQGIRDKLIRKKYSYLANWKDDVLKVFAIARESNDQLINDICSELEQFFNKKYKILEEFSNFKFRDALSRLLGKETGSEIDGNEMTAYKESNHIEFYEENAENVEKIENQVPNELIENQNEINQSIEIQENINNIQDLSGNQKDENSQDVKIVINVPQDTQEFQQENDAKGEEPQDDNIHEMKEAQINDIQEIQDLNKPISEENNEI